MLPCLKNIFVASFLVQLLTATFYFVDESAPAALVVSSEKTKKQVFEIDVPL